LIKSVKKAMDILTILSANAEEPITLGELAEQTGLNKSTCAHIVDTLCESFYVERISRTKGYRLGPWAYMLSRYGRYQNKLVTIAIPVLKWLQAKTGATVFISVICNGKKYIVYHIDKMGILPMSDGSMIQGRLETTATGLLLMTSSTDVVRMTGQLCYAAAEAVAYLLGAAVLVFMYTKNDPDRRVTAGAMAVLLYLFAPFILLAIGIADQVFHFRTPQAQKPDRT